MKKLFLTTGLLFMIAAPVMAEQSGGAVDARAGVAVVDAADVGAKAAGKDVQYTLRVDGITCPFCVATSEKALKKIDGVKGVSSDLKGGTITVCADAEKVAFTDEQLSKLFLGKGFTYKGMETAAQCESL